MAAILIVDSTRRTPLDCTEYDATGGCCACSNSGCHGSTTTWDHMEMSDTSLVYCDVDPYIEPEQDIEDFEHEYFIEIPKRIDPVKNFITKPYFNLKQPVSKTGFKRGQRK